MYPVYGKKSVLGEKPLYWVNRDERKIMLEDGSARRFRADGEALRLTRDKMIGDTTDIRDKSCQMGPRVIEANAEGMTFARAITAAWAPQYAFA